MITAERALPPLRLRLSAADGSLPPYRFIADEHRTSEFLFPIEESRGYEFRGTLWTPGYFEVELAKRRERDVDAASAEPEDVMLALSPEACDRIGEARASQTIDRLGAAAGARRGGRGARARGQISSSSLRRVVCSMPRERPRSGDEGAHRDRGISLVH